MYGADLPMTYRRFIDWVVWMRVYARICRQSLKNMSAATWIVPQTLKPGRTAIAEHGMLAVLDDYHDFGGQSVNKQFRFRTYKSWQQGGEFMLGHSRGSIHVKDLWATPGLLNVDNVMRRRRAWLLGGQRADASHHSIQSQLGRYRSDLEKERESMDASRFVPAYGRRFDLDDEMFGVAMTLLRALVSGHVAKEASRKIDGIAERQRVSPGELHDNAEASGPEEESYHYHLHVRAQAHAHFRELRQFIVPTPYVQFCAGPPPPALKDTQMEWLAGVGEQCLSARLLAQRTDAQMLLKSPWCLRTVEEFRQVVDVEWESRSSTRPFLTPGDGSCGIHTYCGLDVCSYDLCKIRGDAAITDDEYESVLAVARAQDAQRGDEQSTAADAVVAGCVEGVKLTLSNGHSECMPLCEFYHRADVRLVPQLVDWSNHSKACADWQFYSGGVNVAIGPTDIRKEFVCKKTNQKKRIRSCEKS